MKFVTAINLWKVFDQVSTLLSIFLLVQQQISFHQETFDPFVVATKIKYQINFTKHYDFIKVLFHIIKIPVQKVEPLVVCLNSRKDYFQVLVVNFDLLTFGSIRYYCYPSTAFAEQNSIRFAEA